MSVAHMRVCVSFLISDFFYWVSRELEAITDSHTPLLNSWEKHLQPTPC